MSAQLQQLQQHIDATEIAQQQDHEGRSSLYQPLEALMEKGIAAQDIKKLREAGYFTIEAVAHSTRRELNAVKGISEAKSEKVLTEAQKYVHMGFESAATVLEREKACIKVTTGCSELDEILQGGMQSGTITEIYGEFRCGKTQICHTLCVTSQLSVSQGGGEGKVLFIDTENTFRAERIREIAARFNLDSDSVLDNVCIARAHNTEHQTELLKGAAALMADDAYAMVIVDSVTSLFRTEYMGRGELASRQNALGRFLRNLQRLADEFGVAVVVTNQVVASVEGGIGAYAGPTIKPIGGNIMAHATTTRLWLKKKGGDRRNAKVVASPCLPEADADFMIKLEGISSVEG